MATQLEKVVVDADCVELENPGPNSCEDLFNRSSRYKIIFAHFEPALIRHRKRFSVELTVGVQRQFLENYKCRGHHVLRQLLLQQIAQLINRWSTTGSSNNIGHQSPVSRTVFSGQYNRFSDRGMPPQCCFDFSQFDSESTSLYLIVRA